MAPAVGAHKEEVKNWLQSFWTEKYKKAKGTSAAKANMVKDAVSASLNTVLSLTGTTLGLTNDEYAAYGDSLITG